MRRGCAGFIAAVLAFAGCKSTDNNNKDTAATPASRSKNDGKVPAWLDSPDRAPDRADLADSSIPPGQDCVGGRVLDLNNRPVAKAYIQVDVVNPSPGPPAASVGIYTDQDGNFYSRGLKPGKTYNLTAEATLNNRIYTATAQTTIPKTNITLMLRDDQGSPPFGILKGPAGGSFPPPPSPFEPGNERIPATAFPPTPKPADGAWAPGSGANNPVPTAITPGTPRTAPLPSGPSGPIPPPDDLSAPAPRVPGRPENVADRPSPWNAPPVAIPGPPTLPPSPSYPSPTPPPSPPETTNMGLSFTGKGFILLDTLDRSWQFPSNKSVLLVEFMMTTCQPSKRTVPILTDLQARYATAGLQVIAVACDQPTRERPRIDQKERAEAAANYIRDNNLNYQVFVEPGVNSGSVRDRFNVLEYPTIVLLDGSGNVLWQGNPLKHQQDLEAAVRKALGK